PITTAQPRRAVVQAVRDMPGKDHGSYWFDPASGGWIWLDEPYDGALVHRVEERRSWALARGLTLVVPKWDGLYFPGQCIPNLIGEDPALVHRIARILAQMPSFPEPDPWPEPSGLYDEGFVSPK